MFTVTLDSTEFADLLRLPAITIKRQQKLLFSKIIEAEFVLQLYYQGLNFKTFEILHAQQIIAV